MTSTAPPPSPVPRHGALLLVEHDPAMRAQFRHALEQGGFRVLAAEHQASALQLAAASSDPITLLISHAPATGGSAATLVDALAQVRPGVPALLLPAHCTSTDLLARVRQMLTRTV
jgi:DNA-binding NtrC family response regulator